MTPRFLKQVFAALFTAVFACGIATAHLLTRDYVGLECELQRSKQPSVIVLEREAFSPPPRRVVTELMHFLVAAPWPRVCSSEMKSEAAATQVLHIQLKVHEKPASSNCGVPG